MSDWPQTLKCSTTSSSARAAWYNLDSSINRRTPFSVKFSCTKSHLLAQQLAHRMYTALFGMLYVALRTSKQLS